MSKKTLALILILAAVSGILVYAGASHRPAPITANVNQAVEKTISVVIDTGDGSSLANSTFTVTTKAETTVFSVLQDVTTKAGIALDFDPPGQYGVFVKAIAGKVGTDKQFWIYQINGQDGQVAADAATVKNGDTVTWKYTTASAN